ncbi:MAG: hypothetical protein VX642_02355 [Bdellovibrionota bacterium]|nr:hypothetical protein [Bdellovibrionota bacterium]
MKFLKPLLFSVILSSFIPAILLAKTIVEPSSSAIQDIPKEHFEFSYKNINALVGLICVGEENIARLTTGGGIEDSRLSVSKWQITEVDGEVHVNGFCNASTFLNANQIEVGDSYELDLRFNTNLIKESKGDVLVRGRIGAGEVQILFNTTADIINREIKNKTIVKNIAIAEGLAGIRAGSAGQFINDNFPDLSTILTRVPNMSFCNHDARECRGNSWKTSQGSKLYKSAFGAAWLMNFAAIEVGDSLFYQAIKYIEAGSSFRVPPFDCGNGLSCGASVALRANTPSVFSCTKFNERYSAQMTEQLCREIQTKISF